MRARTAASCALVLATAVAVAAFAAKPPRDDTWTAPDFPAAEIRSIAFLPVAMYEPSLENRRLVETAVGQALRGTGYRFVSTLVTHEALAREGGDSLLRAFDAQLLRNGRVDSLAAPALSRSVRARALLTVRVDRMERLQLEYNQSGKPSTTVALSAALVDSTGRLLWTAHGVHTLEGQYQEPANGSLGVQAGGLQTQLVTGRIGAPPFHEVLASLWATWVPKFPARPPAAVAN